MLAAYRGKLRLKKPGADGSVSTEDGNCLAPNLVAIGVAGDHYVIQDVACHYRKRVVCAAGLMTV